MTNETEEGNFKSFHHNIAALLIFELYLGALDYLRPREGGSLLVLSKKIDVLAISVPEEITGSDRVLST